MALAILELLDTRCEKTFGTKRAYRSFQSLGHFLSARVALSADLPRLYNDERNPLFSTFKNPFSQRVVLFVFDRSSSVGVRDDAWRWNAFPLGVRSSCR